MNCPKAYPKSARLFPSTVIISSDELLGSAWLLMKLLIARALISVGSDGESIPSAYAGGVSRIRSDPALPQVGLSRLFPTPSYGSTSAHPVFAPATPSANTADTTIRHCVFIWRPFFSAVSRDQPSPAT